MHPQVKEIDPFTDVYNELLAGEAARFRQRLADREVEDYIPADKDVAKAKLLEIVSAAVDRLKILYEDHEARTAAASADRSARLAFDDSDEGERLRRFQIACGRSLNRCLDTLLKLRKAEEKPHPELVPMAPVFPEASMPIDELSFPGAQCELADAEPSSGDVSPSSTDSNGTPDRSTGVSTTKDRITRNEPTSPPNEPTTAESATADDQGNARNEPNSVVEAGRMPENDGDSGEEIGAIPPGLSGQLYSRDRARKAMPPGMPMQTVSRSDEPPDLVAPVPHSLEKNPGR